MINFLIWSPEYDDSSGGIIALHKLADLIAKQGESCYILSDNTIKDSSAKTLKDLQNVSLDINKVMMIYPEIVNGNPNGAKYVTRWLLNTPGVCGGNGIFDDNDLIYKYYDYFQAPDETKVKGELRTFNLKLNQFYNKNLKREGECYIIKKGKNKTLDKHHPQSINIDTYINDDYLVEIFNTKETFVSYDSMCFHLQQAALCGCVPIVIPDEGVSKEEFIKKAPVNKYGVAYGFDDIEHAKATMSLLKDYLIEMEKQSFEQVKKFISDSYNHINKI
jgi:hypothetical protein